MLEHIVRPRLDIFRPANPNGAAMILAPGGGYRYVVIDKEGYELARWLAARGVTAYVLFYRLPGDGWKNSADAPLADAQRAVRSEEHTSEIPSLMRNSYAVLCLKKKKHNRTKMHETVLGKHTGQKHQIPRQRGS